MDAGSECDADVDGVADDDEFADWDGDGDEDATGILAESYAACVSDVFAAGDADDAEFASSYADSVSDGGVVVAGVEFLMATSHNQSMLARWVCGGPVCDADSDLL